MTPYPVPNKPKSTDLCNAFVKGAPHDAPGAVFYGVTAANHAEWLRVVRSGMDWWYIDNSYFDVVRGQQFRITKRRLQHTGLGTSDGKRFAALGLTIAPWVHRPDGYTLYVEQSPSFMKTFGGGWLPPVGCKLRPWNRNKKEAGTSLADDLAGALVTYTHSSAAAVESLLAGVRACVSPLSACWHATGHGQTREGLMNVLADNQFTLAEIKSGYAWSVVK